MHLSPVISGPDHYKLAKAFGGEYDRIPIRARWIPDRDFLGRDFAPQSGIRVGSCPAYSLGMYRPAVRLLLKLSRSSRDCCRRAPPGNNPSNGISVQNPRYRLLSIQSPSSIRKLPDSLPGSFDQVVQIHLMEDSMGSGTRCHYTWAISSKGPQSRSAIPRRDGD